MEGRGESRHFLTYNYRRFLTYYSKERWILQTTNSLQQASYTMALQISRGPWLYRTHYRHDGMACLCQLTKWLRLTGNDAIVNVRCTWLLSESYQPVTDRPCRPLRPSYDCTDHVSTCPSLGVWAPHGYSLPHANPSIRSGSGSLLQPSGKLAMQAYTSERLLYQSIPLHRPCETVNPVKQLGVTQPT